MKIAILGTRGIPNHYGGFEQFAEYFSVFLAEKNHEVYCYNSHNHPHQSSSFHGVKIIHQFDPEFKLGTFGQFIYDFNCIMDARKRDFDIILQLGYTSSSIWSFLMPKNSIVITNMDGVEWKRSKYAKPVQQFLKYAERLAAKNSDYLVSDSIGIQRFLKKRYHVNSTYIAYGAHPFSNQDEEIILHYGVEKQNYSMLIARFEPENNLQMILDGFVLSQNKSPFLVIGKHETKYGEFLKNRYKNHPNIRFIGGVYDINHLNNLRFYSNLYFHGHSVGGTNPSLLEAMASKALIAAHNNEFNKGVLKENAFYFSNAQEVSDLFLNIDKSKFLNLIDNNYKAIINDFNWEKINSEYLQLFVDSMEQSTKRK
jgi:glycosyltransferase involved in cell wall biosynthesis